MKNCLLKNGQCRCVFFNDTHIHKQHPELSWSNALTDSFDSPCTVAPAAHLWLGEPLFEIRVSNERLGWYWYHHIHGHENVITEAWGSLLCFWGSHNYVFGRYLHSLQMLAACSRPKRLGSDPAPPAQPSTRALRRAFQGLRQQLQDVGRRLSRSDGQTVTV